MNTRPRVAAPPRSPKARFFFALRPDAGSATALAATARRLADSFGGRPLAANDLHLTLVFVGMRPVGDAQRLAAMLEAVPGRVADEALPLALSELGSFGRGVLWMGPGERSEQSARERAVHALVARWVRVLRGRLGDEGIEFDERPLRMHVTLVRGARGFEPRSTDPRNRPGDTSGNVPVVEPASWTLALGASYPDSTPGKRYRWTSRGDDVTRL